MKKFTLSILFFFIFSFSYPAHAQDTNLYNFIFIFLNDELVSFNEIYPQVKNKITYIPIDSFAESINATAKWNKNQEKMILSKNNQTIILDSLLKSVITDKKIIHTNSIYFNQGKVMAPLRLIAENFGYDVTYIPNGPICRIKNKYAKISDQELYNQHKDKLIKEKQKMILEKKVKATSKYKIAYITFDDGPTIYTKEFLKILKQYDANATFFMLSNRIKMYPQAVKQVIQQGNIIGLHGVSHDVNKIYQSPNSLLLEMNQCNSSLESIAHIKSNLIRTPYGSKPYITSEYMDLISSHGYKMWDWNVDSGDSLLKSDSLDSSQIILQNVKIQINKHEVPVILFHEKARTLNALPKVLDHLKKEGYILLPIDPNDKPHNFINKIYY